MDIIELLTQFDLTRVEATIYVKLISNGELSGYEVAKLTGISRSNTYTSLAGLVDKGAAYLVEGKVTKYSAVPIKEYCENKIRSMKETKKRIINNIPEKQEEVNGYITIKGNKHIINKMKNMILDAEERIYISASKDILKIIVTEIEKAINKGIKIVIITNDLFELNGITIYHTEKKLSQIRLISDSTKVLVGELSNVEYSTCLYSKKKNLVDLIKDSLKNEITLINMIDKTN